MNQQSTATAAPVIGDGFNLIVGTETPDDGKARTQSEESQHIGVPALAKPENEQWVLRGIHDSFNGGEAWPIVGGVGW